MYIVIKMDTFMFSADGWSIHDAWEPIKNFFSHGRHEDTDYYEGSAQVMDWWVYFFAHFSAALKIKASWETVAFKKLANRIV